MSDDIVTRLRETGGLDASLHNQAADEIERLRRERDEARHGDSVATATLQGCIEERTTLRAERDEARREVCAYVSGRYGKDVVTLDRAAALDEANRRGWDCFKEVKRDR